MGYETTMFVVDTYGRKKGYWRIVASVELGKVAYNEMGKLIEELRAKKIPETILKKLEKCKEETDDSKKMDLKIELAKRLPHIIIGEDLCFTDDYGDVLMVTTPEEVIKRMKHDYAKHLIEDGYEYQPFEIALGILEAVKGDKNKKVILFGN